MICFDSAMCYYCFHAVLPRCFKVIPAHFSFIGFLSIYIPNFYIEFYKLKLIFKFVQKKMMKLKLAGNTLKWPQNDMETKVTHRRVEINHLCSIFSYFEMLHTIVMFPYKLLYLCCYT